MMRKAWVAAALFAAAGVVHASATRQPGTPPTPQEQVDAAREAIRQGETYLNDNQNEAAIAAFESAIQANGFAQLPESARYRTLLVTGTLAYNAGNYTRAYELLKRATAFGQAEGLAWALPCS